MATSKRPTSARDKATRGPLIRRTILVVLVLAGAVVAAVTQPIRLGLDLRGGTQVVLEAQPGPNTPLEDDTVDRTLEVLRRRVDSLGVAEPNLQRSGSARIIVELPGVTDPDEAMDVIGRTAQLTFHPVLDLASESDVEEQVAEDGPIATDEELAIFDEDGMPIRIGPAELTGDDVQTAGIAIGQFVDRFDVTLEFRGPGGRAWQELTAEAACAPPGDPQRRVAIVLDNEVISSPQVQETVPCGQGIPGGTTSITGDFLQEDAEELSLLLRAGALPVPIEVVERAVIGPTLGAAAIDASIMAGLIGLGTTLIFMMAAYRLYGFLASVSLALYALLSYSALALIGATLTLPGLAGFVLAVGMAVDANILGFERAKEEFAAGRSSRSATKTGFDRSLSAIVDSNVTTVIASVLLILLASGAVRGFGVVLTIGVFVSMFTALVVTRVLVEWALRVPGLAERTSVLGLTAWMKVRRWLEARQPDLMGKTRWWLGGAVVAILIGFAGMASQGLIWGLEFTGGQLLEYRTEQQIDVDELRADLADVGLSSALVQSTDDNQIAVRTRELEDAEEQALLDAIAARGGELEVVREEFVGPTIGAELRRNAFLALGIALAGQVAYMAVRFRWTYGLSAILGMAHDVILLVGLFAWFGRTFDGVFLAALLTVIGYSINDNVVIFDRVREARQLNPKEPLASITNRALIETLPRTVNTGMGALFILIALWVLGGDTLSDFALALIIGTTVGMYSSMVIASPLFLWFEKISPQSDKPVKRSPTSRPRGDRAVV